MAKSRSAPQPSTLDRIREQYPYLAWLINDPEVGNLLRQAVNPNTTFSPQRFQAELLNTSWWQSRSEARRAWEIKGSTDPGSANRDRAAMTARIGSIGQNLGVALSDAQQRYIAELALQEGTDINDPRIRKGIVDIYRGGQAGTDIGMIPTVRQQAISMAKQEYFLPLTDADAWAARIAEGGNSVEDLRAILQERAISRYPHLQPQLSTGSTMADIFSGHIGTISDELEISPSEVDLTSGQWLKVVDQYDPTDGNHRPLTLSETRTLARQDNRWWKTANGRAMDSGMANFMLKTFGARK